MGWALADVYIVVYCDRQLKSQLIAFLLPIFPNLVPFLNLLVSCIFCLSLFSSTSSHPSGQSASPVLFLCPPNDYPCRPPAGPSSWHHPISKLLLCLGSVHMLWQKQYNQIGKQGDPVPPEAFREPQGMRRKSCFVGFLVALICFLQRRIQLFWGVLDPAVSWNI